MKAQGRDRIDVLSLGVVWGLKCTFLEVETTNQSSLSSLTSQMLSGSRYKHLKCQIVSTNYHRSVTQKFWSSEGNMQMRRTDFAMP